MASLTSSWHSSSLTFVSSSAQNQQPQSIRPLSTPTTNNSRRFTLPSRSKMAKIASLLLFVLLVIIVVGFVIGDSTTEQSQNANGNARSRLRAKSLSLKKKKPGLGLRARAEDPSNTSEASPVTQTEGLVDDNTSGEIQRESTTTTTRPKSKKASRSSVTNKPERESVASTGGGIPVGCSECDPTSCKTLAESSCHAGLVMDKCSCCLVCGSGEGNRCHNASIPNLSYTTDVGMCGTGLACILRKDLDPNEPREALCECRDRRLVCGNDNQTYISECKLREVAHSSPGLAIASWGPCVSAPWMPSSVENITVSEGEDASLSCEVKGYPSPVIHWEFLSTVASGAPIILPGDDSSVVVTVRGGPEKMMSTSWIQIISVTNERQGIYYCVARNSEGVTRSSASVTISQAPNQGTLPAPESIDS